MSIERKNSLRGAWPLGTCLLLCFTLWWVTNSEREAEPSLSTPTFTAEAETSAASSLPALPPEVESPDEPLIESMERIHEPQAELPEASPLAENVALVLEGIVTDPNGNAVVPSSYWIRYDSVRGTDFGPQPSWESIATENHAKENHHFSLYGLRHKGMVDLIISAPGYHRTEMEVEAGSKGLHVIMKPSLTIHGRVVGLTEDQLADARIQFRPSGIPTNTGSLTRPRGLREVVIQPDGTFQFSGIRERTDGEISVRLAKLNRVIATVPKVQPWWSSEIADPRLAPLEIAKLHSYSVLVQTKSGAYFNGTQCLVFSPPELIAEAPVRAYFTGAQLEWQDARNELEILLCHPNFRALRTRVKPGKTVLKLEPAHFAVIELRNKPIIPENMEVGIEFTSSVAHGLLNRQSVLPSPLPTPLPPLGIPEAGSYSFSLTLKEKGMPGHGEDVYFPSGKPFITLDVQDTPGQVFQLTFPNIGIAEASERIRVRKEEEAKRRSRLRR